MSNPTVRTQAELLARIPASVHQQQVEGDDIRDLVASITSIAALGNAYPELPAEAGLVLAGIYPYGDVRRYGAANAKTGAQNLAALQAAANALPSTGRITAPDDGDYTVTGDVTISTSGVVLNFGKAKFTQTGANKRTFILSAVSDVEVIGGRFIGKGTEHVGGLATYNNVAAIYMSGDCTNISIHGVKATNHAGGSIRWGGGTMTSLRIYDCKLVGIGTAGGIAAGDNNDDAAIGSFGTTADNDTQIVGCDISEHCFGVFLARGRGALLRNVIHDIRGQHGYYLSAMSDVDLQGMVRTCAQTGCKNQIATDATVATDVRAGPLLVKGCQTGVDTSVASAVVNSYYDRVKMTGVDVVDCTTNYGIAVDTVRNFELSDFTIDGGAAATMAYGLFLNRVAGHIKGGTVSRTSWNGHFGTLINDLTIEDVDFVDCALNTEAGADNNRYRYLQQQQKDATALVANPRFIVKRCTYKFTVAEPTWFASANGFVVRFSTGVFGHVVGNKNDNMTTRGYLSSTATDLQQMEIEGDVAPTFGANVAINRSLGNRHNVVATTNAAHNINAPTNSTPGMCLVRISNTSGGALGAATFNAIYKLQAAWVQPATGFSRSVMFCQFAGSTNMIEVWRTAADVAN